MSWVLADCVHRSGNQIESERKSEPRKCCFRWERLKCAWAVRRRTRSQWKSKQKGSQRRREHQVTERGGWRGQVWGREGAAKGKVRNVLFCQSLLGREQRAPVQSQTRGRMNEEISFIMRYPAAGEQRRGSECWKAAKAGGTIRGTCDELERARH